MVARVRGAQIDGVKDGPGEAVDEGRQLMYYYHNRRMKSTKNTRTQFYYGYKPMKKVYYSKGAYQAAVPEETTPAEYKLMPFTFERQQEIKEWAITKEGIEVKVVFTR